MGVLDDAIREHLELKRRHGVAEEELRRQEEEALGPARREVAPADADDVDRAGEEPAAEEQAPAEAEAAQQAELEQDADLEAVELGEDEPPELALAEDAEATGPEQELGAPSFDEARADLDGPAGDRDESLADLDEARRAGARDEPLAGADLDEPRPSREIDEPQASADRDESRWSADLDEPRPSREIDEPQASAERDESRWSADLDEPRPSADLDDSRSSAGVEEAHRSAEGDEGRSSADREDSGAGQETSFYDVEEHFAAEDDSEPRVGDTPPHGFDALGDDELLDEAEDEDEESGDDADVLEDTPDFLQETPEHDRLWFEQKPPRDFDFD